jgi:hypothetical protein
MTSRILRLVAQGRKKEAEALNYETEGHEGHATSLPS